MPRLLSSLPRPLSRALVHALIASALLLAVGTTTAHAAACPPAPGPQSCTISAWSDTSTDQASPDTNAGKDPALQALEDPAGKSRYLWLSYSTGDIPVGASVTSAKLRLWATSSAPTT